MPAGVDSQTKKIKICEANKSRDGVPRGAGKVNETTVTQKGQLATVSAFKEKQTKLHLHLGDENLLSCPQTTADKHSKKIELKWRRFIVIQVPLQQQRMSIKKGKNTELSAKADTMQNY